MSVVSEGVECVSCFSLRGARDKLLRLWLVIAGDWATAQSLLPVYYCECRNTMLL